MALLEVWLSDDNAIVREKFRRNIVHSMTPMSRRSSARASREGSLSVDDPDETARVVVSLILGANEPPGDLFVARQAGSRFDRVDRGRFGAYTARSSGSSAWHRATLQLVDERRSALVVRPALLKENA